jgi:hypothetical protein
VHALLGVLRPHPFFWRLEYYRKGKVDGHSGLQKDLFAGRSSDRWSSCDRGGCQVAKFATRIDAQRSLSLRSGAQSRKVRKNPELSESGLIRDALTVLRCVIYPACPIRSLRWSYADDALPQGPIAGFDRGG